VRQLGVDGGGEKGLVPLEAEEDHGLAARLSDMNLLQCVSTGSFLKVVGTQHKWFAVTVEIAAAGSPNQGLPISRFVGLARFVSGRREIYRAVLYRLIGGLGDDAVGEHVFGKVDHIVDDHIGAGCLQPEYAIGEISQAVEGSVKLLRGPGRN